MESTYRDPNDHYWVVSEPNTLVDQYMMFCTVTHLLAQDDTDPVEESLNENLSLSKVDAFPSEPHHNGLYIYV